MNQPYYAKNDLTGKPEQTKVILDINKGFVPTPLDAFERLFFALFGLQRPEDLKMNNHVEDWTLQIFKLIFGAYLLMAGIVLINLLIAMMSDTYQRIQQQSDIEWKFGRSKLITSMSKTEMAPAPINLFTSWMTY